MSILDYILGRTKKEVVEEIEEVVAEPTREDKYALAKDAKVRQLAVDEIEKDLYSIATKYRDFRYTSSHTRSYTESDFVSFDYTIFDDIITGDRITEYNIPSHFSHLVEVLTDQVMEELGYEPQYKKLIDFDKYKD